jgi:peptide/nickel transport system permease protein
MLLYILRRILLFIPSLFFITLAAFFINALTPGDPVARILGAELDIHGNANTDERQYRSLQHQLGLDLPLFYFSFGTKADPDSLFLIKNSLHRKSVKALSRQTGHPKEILHYYKMVNAFIRKYPSSAESKLFRSALSATSIEEVNAIYANAAEGNGYFVVTYNKDGLLRLWDYVSTQHSPFKKYIPVIRWHGYNQYHRWIFGDGDKATGPYSTRGIISGDFGRSLANGKKITDLLGEKIGWTVFFTLGGLIISLLISIPLGIISGYKQGSGIDRRSSKFLLLLHSLPSFFTATLSLMLFANPSVLGWFPASGVGPAIEPDGGLFTWITAHIPYLILPLACYAIVSLPFIMRALRGSIIEELDKDYILTARAKGLSEKRVLWHHAFRNSLFPLITLLAWLFPSMIGGSAILETVFSIPGMGLEIVQGIYNRDYPLIVAVFTFTGILTVTGYLLSDILYAFADPRIQLN